MEKYLEAAKPVKTHGLSGELRARVFCDSAGVLGEIDTLYLGKERVPMKIERARPSGNMALLKLAGIDSVEAAAALIGQTLYLDRDELDLPEDTWFTRDLVGLAVTDIDTEEVYGDVTEVLQRTGADVFVMKNSAGRELLFPAIKDVLIKVDIPGGKILIRPLNGLFEN